GRQGRRRERHHAGHGHYLQCAGRRAVGPHPRRAADAGHAAGDLARDPRQGAMTMSESVSFRRDGAVLTLELNRPADGNLLDAAMGAAIIEQLAHLDPEVRVVCLRGAGADFCAGRVSPTPPKGGAVPTAERLRQMVALPALAAGLITRAVPAASLEAEARAMLDTMAACGSVALRACKQYLQHAPAMDPAAASAFASHVAGTALSARY